MHSKTRIAWCGLVLFFVLACWMGYAQDPTQAQPAGTASDASSGKAKGKSYMDQLASQLNLTAEQQGKLRPIVENEEEQIQAVRDDGTLSQQERRRRIANIRSMTRPQIEAILTPDRQRKFAALKDKAGDQ